MGNLGSGELLVIFFVALLVLGPNKLPDAARQVGRAVNEIRRVSGGFQREMREAMQEPMRAAEQAKALGLHVDLGADFVFEARCHYQGWRDKYDEWVEVPSWRIAAHHVYTEVTEKEKKMREKKKQEQLRHEQAEAAGEGSDDE